MVKDPSKTRSLKQFAPCVTDLAGLGTERLAKVLVEESRHNPQLRRRLEQLLREQPAGISEAHGRFGDDEPHMVGDSPEMRLVFDAIRKMAVTDAPILITGESGTGKELAALAIHERSSYQAGPFVAVNCAGMPATLIAAELFGHEKGAFTGAHQRQIGRIEAAQGGTLFLDEIGDLPLDLQGHLLRFLQNSSIERLGGTRTIKINTRVIAATNEELEKAVARGRFRVDLFYRLNVLRMEMPPLRERSEDLELLSTFFLRKFASEMKRPDLRFRPEALAAIRRHSWPGNVRELISCIRRSVVMAEGDCVQVDDLGIGTAPQAPGAGQTGTDSGMPPGSGSNPYGDRPLSPARRGLQPDQIIEALRLCHQNISQAAKHLGVSRVTLYRHMRKNKIGSYAP